MPKGSVPKLLQEAGMVKEALEKIGGTLPGGVTVQDLVKKIEELNAVVVKVDALNAEKTKLVNSKIDATAALSSFLVQARLAIKVQYGADSSEYDMAGGTRSSERKRPIRKPKEK
jgi:hypothetical protein